jgi:hypothetical protein
VTVELEAQDGLTLTQVGNFVASALYEKVCPEFPGGFVTAVAVAVMPEAKLDPAFGDWKPPSIVLNFGKPKDWRK